MSELQRNDLCRCGSGKKYKNCCLRKDDAVSQLSKVAHDVKQVISPQMGPYLFWKRWSAACARNEYGLVYQMLLEGGAIKETFATDADFFVNLSEIGVAFEPVWRLDKIKLSPGHAMFLCHRIDDSDKNADTIASLMKLQKTTDGWRVTDITQKTFKRDKDFILSFDLFGIPSVELAYVTKTKTGWTRPNLADSKQNQSTSAQESAPL